MIIISNILLSCKNQQAVTKLLSSGVNSRGEVEDKRLEAKAKDTKKIRDQGQTLSRPRPRTKDTDASVLRKKRSSKIFFQAISTRGNQKKGLCRFSAKFLAFSNEISTVQKWCCPRAEDRAIFEDLRLRGQGQGLQNVASRTSSMTPPLISRAGD